ncbi:hypothetical protein ACC696_01935 [Rhizobium ruizarguesonis]
MDPISLIVGAIAMGAAAASQKVTEKTVLEAYDGVKSLIVNRYKRLGAVLALEEDPGSETQRKALQEALSNAGADKDGELVAKAKDLGQKLQAAVEKGPDLIGVSIRELKALNAKIAEVFVEGSGTGLKIEKADVENLELGPIKVRSDPK